MSDDNIVKRSLRDRRPGKTDWARLLRQTDEDIAAQAVADPDVAPIAEDNWMAGAELVMPNKEAINIRLDSDVLEYFRNAGAGYQTRINNVLRAYVSAQKKSA